MTKTKRIVHSSFLLALFSLVLGCVVEPREGYYDRDHHRYYHDHTWHEYAEHDGWCG